MRDADRDINLERLHVAHRADYIRAFLLARYGGLWVDSDCLAMKELGWVQDKLMTCDFVAHRERSGHISNDFIGSRPGGKIASCFYNRICEILREGRPLRWISIGAEPLTEILSRTRHSWYEIECEKIQPICWCNPGAFFEVKTAAEHELIFDKSAACYTLSNTEVQFFQAENPQQNLLDRRTFFMYLLEKALGSNVVTI